MSLGLFNFFREKPFGSLPGRSFAGQFWPLVVRSTLFIYELLIYLSLFSLNSYICFPRNLTFLSGEPLAVLQGKCFFLTCVLFQEHSIPYFLCPSSLALLLCLPLLVWAWAARTPVSLSKSLLQVGGTQGWRRKEIPGLVVSVRTSHPGRGMWAKQQEQAAPEPVS